MWNVESARFVSLVVASEGYQLISDHGDEIQMTDRRAGDTFRTTGPAPWAAVSGAPSAERAASIAVPTAEAATAAAAEPRARLA